MKRSYGCRKLMVIMGLMFMCLFYKSAAGAESTVAINKNNFPDVIFRGYVKNFDANEDGCLSKTETDAVTAIDVHYCDISTLKGIEHFEALKTLDCSGNKQLIKLDISNNTALVSLNCSWTGVSTLDICKNTMLEQINVYNCKLISLDVSKNTELRILKCSCNQLTSLDMSKNTNLEELECDENQLTSLDVSKNEKLVSLSCWGNKLISLDFSYNPALSSIHCYNNQLEKLYLDNNSKLKDLECDNNLITQLDVGKNSMLEWLRCSDNPLTILDVSTCPKLKNLICSNNQLTLLDVSHNTELYKLDCSENKLTNLDLSSNRELLVCNCWDNDLINLNLGDNEELLELNCSGNQLKTLDISHCLDLLWFIERNEPIINADGVKSWYVEERYSSYQEELIIDMSTELIPSNPVFVTEISLDKEQITLEVGETSILTLTVSPENTDIKKIQWNSNDPDVATVDENGKVTAVGEGSAHIDVWDQLTRHMSECEVYVLSNAEASGTCGDNLTWKLDDEGVLTISGTGEMSFENDKAPWNALRVKRVLIQEGVTSIRHHAFQGCRNLTTVMIADTVKTIDFFAFAECTSLQSIMIPAGVVRISDSESAFDIFSGCKNLKDIQIASDNPSYCSIDGIVYNKAKDTLLLCPEGKTGSIMIPNGVKCIIGGINSSDHGAFENCDKITTVTIPGSVTSIGARAFKGCSNLANITIPYGVKEIDDGTFHDCTGLTSISLPQSLTSIGGGSLGAFSGCKNLTEIIIPDGVTYIGNYAFSDCSGLKSIRIPDSVTHICDYAFSGCSGLKNIMIPASVLTIGGEENEFNAFTGCSNLMDIEIAPDNPVYSSREGVVYNKKQDALILCPEGKTGVFIVPDGVTRIVSNLNSYSHGAFQGCDKLTGIILPKDVTYINPCLFSGCASLKSITIPDGVTGIDWSAFVGCTNLASITLPASITYIDHNAFYDCPSLKDVYYSGSLEQWKNIRIGSGNDGLLKAAVHVNSTVQYVISGGLRYALVADDKTAIVIESENRNTAELLIPANIKVDDAEYKVITIGNNAFEGMNKLVTVKIEEGITRIENNAFCNCDSLENVALPESLYWIGQSAFGGCTSLTMVNYTGTEYQWNIMQIKGDNASLFNAMNIPEKLSQDEKIKAFVQRCYRIFLKREADITGLNNWINNLKSRKITVLEMIARFITAPEFRNMNYTNEDLGKILYMVMFDKKAEDEELADWVVAADWESVLEGIKELCMTREFISFCEECGIKPIPDNSTITDMSVILSNTCLLLNTGDTKTIDVKIYPEGFGGRYIVWSSTNPDVVSVDENGQVKAVSVGTAIITVNVAKENQNYIIATCLVTVNPSEKLNAFVTRCYEIILERNPDAGGLRTWINELNSGRKTAAEIIDRFMNSAEFVGKQYSNEKKVDILYRAMLGRNADAAGKANWVKKLESGQTLAHVINGFCFSKEFRDLCDSYGIKAGFVNIPETDTTAEGKIKDFVQRCYRIILDREADPSGMQTWYEQLSSGKKAAAEIIDRFVNSPEFSGKRYSHSDSVEILYKAMLGRGSDAAGKANWVSKLDAGQPFAVVINGFCVSKEFTGICASYGIRPGSVTVQPLSGVADEEALSLLALNAKEPITRRSETKPNRVEIINPSDTIDMNIGTAVQAVYINEEKAKEFIGRCYRVILGREASQAELENWIGQMVNGTKTPDQIARGFLFSNEFKGKNLNNETVVKILYKVYMNRDADPEGLKTWTEKLDGGTSLNDLLNTFSKTSEFKKVISEMSK